MAAVVFRLGSATAPVDEGVPLRCAFAVACSLSTLAMAHALRGGTRPVVQRASQRGAGDTSQAAAAGAALAAGHVAMGTATAIAQASAHKVQVALTQLHVREDPPGSNHGPKVDEYNRTAGYADNMKMDRKGHAWCLSFCYWSLQQAAARLGISNPLRRTGYCPGLFKWARREGRLAETPRRGDIFLIPSRRPDISHGHAGFVTEAHGGVISTVEGNTSGRARNGVYEKRRQSGRLDFVRV